MNKKEFQEVLNKINLYGDKKEYKELIANIKHNICQNIRIARKLSNINSETAALLLDIEPQSLRRIEAEGDRDDVSSKVLIMAIISFKPDANFYFNDWHENEKILKK